MASSVAPSSSASCVFRETPIQMGPPQAWTASELTEMGLSPTQVASLLLRYYDSYDKYCDGLFDQPSKVKPRRRSRRRRRGSARGGSELSASSVSTGTSSVDALKGGYCYEKLVIHGHEGLVTAELGGRPTFEQILTSRKGYWDVGKLSEMSVSRVAPGVYHAGRAGMRAVDVLTGLANSGAGTWPVGSLGYSLENGAAEAAYVSLTDCLAASMLDHSSFSVSHEMDLRKHDSFSVVCLSDQDARYYGQKFSLPVYSLSKCAPFFADKVCVYNPHGVLVPDEAFGLHKTSFRYIVPAGFDDFTTDWVASAYFDFSCLTTGTAYLAMFTHRKRDAVLESVGEYPAVEDVALLDESWLDEDAVGKLRCEFESESWTINPVVGVPLAAVFAIALDGDTWPKQTVGDRFARLMAESKAKKELVAFDPLPRVFGVLPQSSDSGKRNLKYKDSQYKIRRVELDCDVALFVDLRTSDEDKFSMWMLECEKAFDDEFVAKLSYKAVRKTHQGFEFVGDVRRTLNPIKAMRMSKAVTSLFSMGLDRWESAPVLVMGPRVGGKMWRKG